jgi:hypothetical protein
MATINDISIIDSNTAEARRVDSGIERTLCSLALCGSKNLTVYRRTIRGAANSRARPGTTITSSMS